MLFLKDHWKRCTIAAIVVLILGGIGWEYFGHHFESTDILELSISYTLNGFAPTAEQLEDYLLWRADYRESLRHGDTAAAEYFKAKMDAIVKRARGKVPGVGVRSGSEGGRITQADRQEFLRKEKESGRYQKKLEQAYKDFGLEHLIGVDVSDAYPKIQPTIPAPPRRLKLPPLEPTEPTAPADDQ